MAVTWPIDGSRFTAGRRMLASDMRMLAEAYNDLRVRRFNDRLIRIAQGPIGNGEAVYSVNATTVSVTPPSADQAALGFALSDALDAGEIHVLRSGELEINLAALGEDYIAEEDNVLGGPVVTWVEVTNNVRRTYTAPANTYRRRRKRRAENRDPETDDEYREELRRGARLTGTQKRYDRDGKPFFIAVYVRPDGSKFTDTDFRG